MIPEDLALLKSVNAKAQALLAQVSEATDEPGNPQMVRDLAQCILELTRVIGRTKV